MHSKKKLINYQWANIKNIKRKPVAGGEGLIIFIEKVTTSTSYANRPFSQKWR